jgi:hypothetical protein
MLSEIERIHLRTANYCRTCPTKSGKCPSKSDFDWTLVRSHKKMVSLYIFLLWQNPIANSLNLYFAIKFTRHSSILLNVASEWLYILVLLLIYILWRIYVRPNSSYVRPLIGQMSCQVKYLFATLIFTTVTIYLTILLWIIIFQTLLANMLRKSIDIPFSNPYIVEKLCSK